MKPKSALLQPHTPFYYPEFTNELHYECELVLRISKNGKYIQEKFANKYYDAITAGIDFTARDIQNELKEKGLPWEKAKAWDNSAVIGKWVPLANIKNKKDIKSIWLQTHRAIRLYVHFESSSMIIYYLPWSVRHQSPRALTLGNVVQ